MQNQYTHKNRQKRLSRILNKYLETASKREFGMARLLEDLTNVPNKRHEINLSLGRGYLLRDQHKGGVS